MKTIVTAAIAGIVFAIGLLVSDMTVPAKITAFLDVGGAWDPQLAFVMAAALGVYAPFAWIARQRRRPVFDTRFYWPEPHAIDAKLVGGAAIFGVGWGLSGYCPGPAVASLGAGDLGTLAFIGGVIAGIAITRLGSRRRA